jgi:arylsulfatase A-like enzyme
LALAVVGAWTLGARGASPAQTRPNVIVVETDDQTQESIKVMRNVKSLIGDAGTTFRRSFVNYSLCCPSRSTFLTGQYAHNHGVWSNQEPQGGFARFESLHADNNLATWLQDAGYYTAMIGRYLNGYTYSPRVPPGWSEWRATANQNVYDYTLDENGRFVRYGHDPSDFKQDVLTDKAVGLIDRRAPKDQPFFLWLTYTAPHAGGPWNDPNPPHDCDNAPKPAPRDAHRFDNEPLPQPPNFDEADVSDKPARIRNRSRLNETAIAYIQRNYRCELESLLSVDDGVRRVVEALRDNRELADTLIIYTSDNGFFHGEHRIAQGKTGIYEESIRVPLLLRGPGIPRDRTVRALAVNADLAPTIVDATDAKPGLVMDGRSLIPEAANPGIEGGRELLVEQPSFQALRTGRYMYAEYTSGERELYDLRNDPYELRSRHHDPAYATIRSKLAARLRLLGGCSGASCRIHRPDPVP